MLIMKERILLFMFLLMCCLFYSCSDDGFEYESDFHKSYEVWLSFKEESSNSYVFTVQRSSVFGGSRETTIVVDNGVVKERSFVCSIRKEDGTIEILDEWVEAEGELGGHEDSGAYPLSTLDDVYKKAENDWLRKRKDADTYFEAKNDGMISLCGYWPHGCMDDCFTGINISVISKEK